MNEKRKIVTCRSCKARIFFIQTPKGKSHPVDEKPVRIWVEDMVEKPNDENGVTVTFVWKQVEGYMSHFATCPDADRFRKTRKAERAPRDKDGNR